MQSKTCSKCKVEKDVTEFHKSKKEPCGYKSRCKSCRNQDNRNRRLFNKVKKELTSIKVQDPRMNPIERECKTCNEVKPLDSFNKSNRHKLGRMYECKACRNKIALKRKECSKTREKDNEANRKWKQNNPEKVKASNKRYRIKNSENIKEKSKEYRRLNPEKRKETLRKYHENNRDKVAERRIKRRALEKESTPNWSEKDLIKVVYDKAKWLEKLTGKKYHVDHVIPLNGKNVCGLHVWSNLQILEASINCSKQNKLGPIEVVYEETE